MSSKLVFRYNSELSDKEDYIRDVWIDEDNSDWDNDKRLLYRVVLNVFGDYWVMFIYQQDGTVIKIKEGFDFKNEIELEPYDSDEDDD